MMSAIRTVLVFLVVVHFSGLLGMPRRYQQTNDFERGRIVGMLEAGLSAREVARRTGRSRCTIQRYIYTQTNSKHAQ